MYNEGIRKGISESEIKAFIFLRINLEGNTHVQEINVSQLPV
jgi:hypothetical protein